jgi:hypothetical protein
MIMKHLFKIILFILLLLNLIVITMFKIIIIVWLIIYNLNIKKEWFNAFKTYHILIPLLFINMLIQEEYSNIKDYFNLRNCREKLIFKI